MPGPARPPSRQPRSSPPPGAPRPASPESANHAVPIQAPGRPKRSTREVQRDPITDPVPTTRLLLLGRPQSAGAFDSKSFGSGYQVTLRDFRHIDPLEVNLKTNVPYFVGSRRRPGNQLLR